MVDRSGDSHLHPRHGLSGRADSLSADQSLRERLRAAVEMLELVAADRMLLEQIPAEDRQRLHLAVAQVYNPDPVARRQMMKAAERERTRRDGDVLHETGILTLRR